jgi:acyl-CoA dehydrogenase
VIAAKGFENEPFFEIAKHELPMLPKLEGTVHVNMALIVKFMANYFFNPKAYPEVSRRDDPSNDAFFKKPNAGWAKSSFMTTASPIAVVSPTWRFSRSRSSFLRILLRPAE